MVSRGDLLRHRVAAPGNLRELPLTDLPQTRLILRIADEARRANLALWLVGGTVRDLLLGRSSDDVDFLIEASPRRFANALRQRLGGRLNPPTPFGTLLRGRDDRSAALAFSLLAFFNASTAVSMAQRGVTGPWLLPAA